MSVTGAVPVGAGAVRVAIVDDSDVIRRGLRSLLDTSPLLEVVGEAGDGDAAVDLLQREVPDVVLLDVRMPRRDGVSVATAVRGSRTKVLMLTYSDAPDVVRAAVSAGAVGYLVHGTFGADQLVSHVLSVAEGSSVFSPAATDVLREALGQPGRDARPDVGLSPREAEVMELIAAGLSNAEVSRRCFLAEKTVKNHVNHIFAKLGVRTRAEAVATWLGSIEAGR